MSYELQFEAQGQLLCVRARGNRDTENPGAAAREAWTKVAQKCDELALSCVLILSEVTGRYPTLDTYQTMSALDRYGISRDWKIAYVNDDPQCRQDLLFMTAVADKRGFLVRLFADEASARKWLTRVAE